MKRIIISTAIAGLVISVVGASAVNAQDTPLNSMNSAQDLVESAAPLDTHLLRTVDYQKTETSRAEAYELFETVFDCTGVIMHQSYEGEVESKLSFWFGVDGDNNVGGEITDVGAPLSLPDQVLSGKLESDFDTNGRFTGGRMKVAWPFANLGRPVELALMRETFIRVGRKVNGVGKIRRRTSNHTYVAGRIYFDPASHPRLKSLYRISFISATCFPEHGLPKLASAH